MDHRKSFSKSTVKKNGPVTWSGLNDDFIEGFNYAPQQHFVINPPHNFIEKSSNTNNNHMRSNTLSDNQKSPTFRPVGPHVDSTVNRQGTKYSSLIQNPNYRRIPPGYYGRSRLTRI